MNYLNNLKRYHIITILYLLVLIFALIIIYYYLNHYETYQNIDNILGCDLDVVNQVSKIEFIFITSTQCKISQTLFNDLFAPLINVQNKKTFMFNYFTHIIHYEINDDETITENIYDKDSKDIDDAETTTKTNYDMDELFSHIGRFNSFNEIKVPIFIISELEVTIHNTNSNHKNYYIKQFTKDDDYYNTILYKWILESLYKLSKIEYQHNEYCKLLTNDNLVCDKIKFTLFGHSLDLCDDSKTLKDLIMLELFDLDNSSETFYQNDFYAFQFVDTYNTLITPTESSLNESSESNQSELENNSTTTQSTNNPCKFDNDYFYELMIRYNISKTPSLLIELNSNSDIKFNSNILNGGNIPKKDTSGNDNYILIDQTKFYSDNDIFLKDGNLKKILDRFNIATSTLN